MPEKGEIMLSTKKRDRLTDLLWEKRGTYTISKDGYISLDMDNPQVRDSFKKRFAKIRNLRAEGKLIFK